MDNYKLIALDKAMDKKLTAVGLQRKMPKGWRLGEIIFGGKDILMPANLVITQEGGINPSSLIGINGKNFEQEFKINNSGQLTTVALS